DLERRACPSPTLPESPRRSPYAFRGRVGSVQDIRSARSAEKGTGTDHAASGRAIPRHSNHSLWIVGDGATPARRLGPRMERHRSYPRTHSLEDLLTADASGELRRWQGPCERLSQFYLTTRYVDALPGGVMDETSDEDARTALADATSIVTTIRGRLTEPR